MKYLRTAIVCAIASLIYLPVFAASQPETKELLSEALIANADGECPEAIMAPKLKEACDKQLPGLRDTFKQLGELKSVELKETRNTPDGLVKIYVVTFKNGKWTWAANTGSDGKLLVMGTHQEPEWQQT